jgi:hypothetical protein
MLPGVGVLAGFALVARRCGWWPLPTQGPRLVLGLVAGLLGSLAVYLSFVLVSYTWNKDALPPDRQSVSYLVFHPAEVPPLTVRTTKRGQAPTEREDTWHLLTLFGFFIGGGITYLWASAESRRARGNGKEP